jgi:predicted RNase H-related nuclease YkuK (DUF458 family)
MENFTTLFGKPITNLVDYIKDYIDKHDDVEILIGGDSQNYSNEKTVYGFVIALHRKGKGSHVLCKRQKTKIEYDMNTRLLNEVWMSIEIADYLVHNGLPKPKYIDIDLNPDIRFKSNRVLRQAIGMVEGMGYHVRYKHNGAMTQCAANHLVRL